LTVATIGFVVHTQREGAVNLFTETARWLREDGHTAELLDSGETAATGTDVVKPGPLDLAVSLGGDGTMLRTVDLASPAGIPILGVNLGHLGYLAAVEPDHLRDALIRFLAGDYRVESRMTLDVTVTEDCGPGFQDSPGPRPGPAPTDGDRGGLEGLGAPASVLLHKSALNDVVLQRPVGGHTVRTQVFVNDAPFLTFAADSLILATPTGSTAYNLSARGPIVSPRARVQILTPVAPHMLFDRSLVLDAEDVISIAPILDTTADIVVDGWLAATLVPGQTLHCREGDNDAKLVTFGARDFHDILKRKFNLQDR
jgi:NAD+ kinase